MLRLGLLDVAGQLHISFAHSFETHLGLRLRAEETQRCTRHVLAGRSCEWIREKQELEELPRTRSKASSMKPWRGSHG